MSSGSPHFLPLTLYSSPQKSSGPSLFPRRHLFPSTLPPTPEYEAHCPARMHLCLPLFVPFSPNVTPPGPSPPGANLTLPTCFDGGVKLWVRGEVMLLVGPQKSWSEHDTLTPNNRATGSKPHAATPAAKNLKADAKKERGKMRSAL